jgi:signal transduction histidine kinase
MSSLVLAIFYINYQKELQNLDRELISHMNFCSFTLNCKEYKIDFIPKTKESTFYLYKNSREVYGLYPIKKADFFLKIYMSYLDYNKKISYLHKEIVTYLSITLIVVTILSILFSFYALHPLRKALLLTREFIKDILHDVNTPMATMRLNLSMLKREFGENRKIKRVERSIDNLLLLQENLKHYLLHHELEIERINLKELIRGRIEMIESNYPYLRYYINIPLNITIKSNRKGLTRIIDNIISNSSKYNKPNGEVRVEYIKDRVEISDTGEGIANPDRVFERFYKEHERGVGIGLHIVKKLCDELGIEITIKSKLNIGTTIFLKF